LTGNILIILKNLFAASCKAFPFPDQQCKDAMRSMQAICAVIK